MGGRDADNLFATLPGTVLRPGGLVLTRRVIDYCAFAQGAAVVDVGCGAGITVEYLRGQYNLDAVGIDLSAALLRQGRERVPGLPLVQAAGEKLPFADGSVAGVLAECSLSVMQDAGRVLAECGRILAAGGKLAISDLYIRDTGSITLAANRPERDCVSGIMTCEELAKLLTIHGFNTMVWEDQSDCLKEYVARFVMEYGSVQPLRRCIGASLNNRLLSQTGKLGYFLLVAEKYFPA